MAVLAIIGQVLATKDRVPGTIVRKLVTYGTPYFSLSLGTSLYTTLLIAARVGLLWRNGDLNCAKPWDRVALAKVLFTVVPIESALIYSVNLIAFVILLVQLSLKADYPQDLHPQIAVSGQRFVSIIVIYYNIIVGDSDQSYHHASCDGTLRGETRCGWNCN